MGAAVRAPGHRPRTSLVADTVLESWNAANHPDQLRLRDHLDKVAAQLGVQSWTTLVLGLPEPLSLDSGGRNLDNYQFPVARRLALTASPHPPP